MTRWIPFSERLPDGDSIQLIGQSTSATEAYLSDYQRVVGMPYGNMHCQATHWIPLPPFPERVEKGQ